MFVGLDDSKTSRIIMPTMNLRKTVSEICQENERSSTYRIIGLYKSGLLSVAENNVDGKGRKIFTEALRISLRQGEISVASALSVYNTGD